MSDYIKREDAIFIALQQPLYSVVSQIKQLDGIDIVRCKECVNNLVEETNYNHCWHFEKDVDPDDFCSYGEVKNDAQ